ncbi:MAG: Gfo/Idh/MocA family oxidoreductase, partial [Armatimonadetes bacterium]|nr:Gfo/Idh/MocA family oxidoreductase [Armatimonadota bacterium]
TQVFGELEEMLQELRPHIVSIATPATFHADLVCRAAAAGVRAIWCEKAMAASLQECDRMLDICRRHNVLLAVNHQRRWDDDYRAWRQLLDGGAVGTLRSIQLTFGQGRLCRGGSHWLDLALWFADRPVVRGWGRLSDPETLDPGGWGVFETEGGVVIQLDGRTELRHTWEATLIGTRGKLHLSLGGAEQEWWRDGGDGWTRRPLPRNYPVRSPLLNAVENLVQALEGRQQLYCSGENGRAAFEAISAIHLSHHSGGGPIVFPLRERALVIPSL